MLLTHALALSANQLFYARKSPYEYVHSVRIEPAKFILVGTRITYQATGDVGYIYRIIYKYVIHIHVSSTFFFPRLTADVSFHFSKYRILQKFEAQNFVFSRRCDGRRKGYVERVESGGSSSSSSSGGGGG